MGRLKSPKDVQRCPKEDQKRPMMPQRRLKWANDVRNQFSDVESYQKMFNDAAKTSEMYQRRDVRNQFGDVRNQFGDDQSHQKTTSKDDPKTFNDVRRSHRTTSGIIQRRSK